MKKQLLIIFTFFCCFTALSAWAYPETDTAQHKKVRLPVRRSYIGSGMDGALLSLADIKSGGIANPSRLRFSYIINWGFTFNLNISRHIGIYTGIDIKNIGFIEEVDGITIKRRTYNIGAPVGIKIGNMALKQPYAFLGGGIDIPINYKEKSFSIRDQKTKLSENLSDRTPQFMPYVFIGAALHRGITLKLQYYPNNFLNPDFTQNGAHPYAGYDVHIQMMSIGMAVPIKRYHPGMRMIGDKKREAAALKS